MKVGVLTTPNQWFVPYAQKLSEKKIISDLILNHDEIEEGYDVLFILSYHRIIPEKTLKKNKMNIVIHASDLPQGKGWAPMFWQVLEGKDRITFSMFEAADGVDNGDIYMKRELVLDGTELNAELRNKQATFIISMCEEFINKLDQYKTPSVQSGVESFYKKRGPKDSELDIDRSIKDQFNLLRIVDNENYPAFFYLKGKKYLLKIEEENSDENR